ncbi:MAG: DUF4097 family beta strand repeat-containing protein [Acidimicrobiales bacterium]
MKWDFKTTGPIEADVSLGSGLLEVRAAAGDELTVSLEAFGRESRRAQEVIEASEVTFGDGRLRVHVPTRPFKAVEVHCELCVPGGSSLGLRSASADLRCGVRLGALSAKTASGDVEIDRADKVSFSSASGDLDCKQVDRALLVKAASSDVSVQSLDGEADLSLASGDIELGAVTGSLRVNTASGDVSVGRAGKGRLVVNTASGDVSVGVAAGIGAYLDATSLSGEMTCELPMQERSVDEAALEIVCRTMSGDIRIGAARP